MTRTEYEDFKASVDRYLDGLTYVSTGACPGCDECGLADCEDMGCDDYEMAGEGGFSHVYCECCSQPFGGDRYPAHAVNPDTDDIIHLDICADCVYYIEYGRLDDMTMEGMEREEITIIECDCEGKK